MTNEKTGALIAHVRQGKGLTQQGLAERLGVTAQAVSKWETGRSFPDPSLVEGLCGALGLTLEELYAGEQKAPPRKPDWKKLKPFYLRLGLAVLASMVVLTVAELNLTYIDQNTYAFVAINGAYVWIWMAHKVFLLALALWACRKRNEVDPLLASSHGFVLTWLCRDSWPLLVGLLIGGVFFAIENCLLLFVPHISTYFTWRWSPGIPWVHPFALLHEFIWTRMVFSIEFWLNMTACALYTLRKSWLRRRRKMAERPMVRT